MSDREIPTLDILLRECPHNWGRWGDADEVGALNFLGPDEVKRGVSCVEAGTVFTLQVPVANPEGDPVWPGTSGPVRVAAQRFMAYDKSHYLSGKLPGYPGGFEDADDVIMMYLQGTTHYDALGHPWYGDHIYNGYPALSTTGGLEKASILPMGKRGIAGRGVLLDMARYRGKETLERLEWFTHEDLLSCAQAQGCSIDKRDILIVRTGWIGSYYGAGRAEFSRPDYGEPGLAYSERLVQWFHEMEIPNLVTDTLANEVTWDPKTGVFLPLHIALVSRLGVAFTEVAWLEELANTCASEGRFEFFYTAAPLKVVAGTGGPVNPVVIM